MSPSIDMCLKIVYEKIVDNFLLVVAVPLTIAAATTAMARLKPNESTDRIQSFSHPQILSILLFLAIAVIVYYMQRPRMVYLVDYACFRPTYNYRVPYAAFVEHVRPASQPFQ